MTRDELREELAALEGRVELGRHTTAAQEETRTQLRVVDDQYRDLPPRVTRLDLAVFAPRPKPTPKPKRRAQRR